MSDRSDRDDRGRRPTQRGKRQVRCASCTQFLHVWNRHSLCIKCSKKLDSLCAPDNPCVICRDWPDDLWTLYMAAAKESPKKASSAKKRLSLTPSASMDRATLASAPPGPGLSGAPPGFPGYPVMPAMSYAGSPWQPPPLPPWEVERQRAHLMQQLAALPPQPSSAFLTDDQITQGLKDSEYLQSGQRSRSPASSRGSKFSGFKPLDSSFESAGGSPARRSSPRVKRGRGQSDPFPDLPLQQPKRKRSASYAGSLRASEHG